MRRSLSSFVWALLLLFFPGPWLGSVAADQSNRAEAEKLLQQAEKLTDIRASGSHSFRLVAHLTIYWGAGRTSEGNYTLFWVSPTSWRDEIRFADFSQLRVADADKLFVYRNPPNLLPEAFRLLGLLDFPNLLRLTPEATAQSLKEGTGKNSGERIVEIPMPGRIWKLIDHFALSSAIPTRVELADWDYGYTFENYMEFHGHQFPRILTAYKSTKTEIKVQLIELVEDTFNPSAFVIPSDAAVLSWCPHPQRASPTGSHELNSFVPPVRGLIMTPVAFYGVIGKDGKWHDLTVVRSVGKQADSYSFWMNQLLQESARRDL